VLRPAVYLAKMLSEKRRNKFENTRQKFLEETLKHASNHDAYVQYRPSKPKSSGLSDFSPVEESDLSKYLYSDEPDQNARQTSGSEHGHPRYTVYADRPHDWLSALYMKGLFSRGYRPFQNMISHTISETKKTGLKHLFFPSYKINPKIGFQQHVHKLSGRSGWLFTHSNLIFTLAKIVLQKNQEYDFSLNGIVSTGSYMNQEMKRTVSNAFDCDVVRTYGAAERHNMAWGCPESDWYHICSESGVFEVKTSKGIESEGKGELVFTSLARREPPIVRMLTGDIVEIRDRECTCGSEQKSIKIHGRKEHFVENSQEQKLRAKALLDKFCQFEEILCFRLIPRKTCRIEYIPGTGRCEALGHKIEKTAHEELGIKCEAKTVKHIRLSQGGKIPVIVKKT
jgi:phenylacetate-coenzyme A ligase PaaK-like adenylate-forming protein